MIRELAISRASKCDPTDFAFWVRAAEIQMQRDIVPAWGPYLPLGVMPICGYGDISNLDMTRTDALTVVDTIDDPRLAGYHTGLQLAGYAFGRALPDPRVITHELEMVADPYVNIWAYNEGDGLWYAREFSDPVERDTYQIQVSLFGATRSVTVTNFCYPAWFGMINHGGDPRLDHLELCEHPFEVRAGYAITRDDAGKQTNIYGSSADIYRGLEKVKSDPFSRTARRFTSAAGTPAAG